MMPSYARLKKQLETLQAQVESARQAELLPIIKRMRQEMARHGISAADLDGVPGLAKSANKKVAGKRPVKGAGTPKFRDPKSGLTWSGFGRAPGWIASKRDRTKFLIDRSTDGQGASLVSPKTATKGKAASKKVIAKQPAGRKVSTAAKKTVGRTLAKEIAKKIAETRKKEISSHIQTGDSTQLSVK